ncbi:MAG: tetratricopeptide repeat protein, partial [Planctomycetota bacterium]
GLMTGMGKYDAAVQAYQTAMRVQPKTTGPRSNLAALYEDMAGQRQQSGQAAEGVRYQQAAQQLRRAELPLLIRDAKLLPDNAMLQFRLGSALYLDGQWQEAMKSLKRAAEIEPDNSQYQTMVRLLQQKLDDPSSRD